MKKVSSSDSFALKVILYPNFRVYARESKKIIFNHKVSSLRESAPIEMELYQTESVGRECKIITVLGRECCRAPRLVLLGAKQGYPVKPEFLEHFF